MLNISGLFRGIIFCYDNKELVNEQSTDVEADQLTYWIMDTSSNNRISVDIIFLFARFPVRRILSRERFKSCSYSGTMPLNEWIVCPPM